MRRFNFSDPDFATAFAAFVEERRETPEDVDAVVRDVLAAVRGEGLAAIASALIVPASQFDD